MKKRTSKEILSEALLELSSTTPVDKITVKQIVEASGLSLQTFYNHFKDKYELILWIHKSEGDRTIARLGQDGYDYDDLIMDNIRFYLQHREFMYNALNNTHGSVSYAEMSSDNAYRVWCEYILKHHGITELPEEVDFDLKMYCYAFMRMTAEWAFHRTDISLETFARYMKDAMPEKLKPYLVGKS